MSSPDLPLLSTSLQKYYKDSKSDYRSMRDDHVGELNNNVDTSSGNNNSNNNNDNRLIHSNSILNLLYIDQSDMLTDINIDNILDSTNDHEDDGLLLEDMPYININNEHFNNTDSNITNNTSDEKIEKHEHTKNISVFYSIWNLSNDIIANSAISLPYSLASAGLPFGIILMIIYSYSCYESLILVQLMCDSLKLSTFADLSYKGLGRFGFYISNICIFLTNWGGIVGGFMMMGTIGTDLLIRFFGDHYLFTRTNLIVGSSILFGPLAYYKSLNRFALLSLIAVWFQISIFLAIIFRFILSYSDIQWSKPDIPLNALNFAQHSWMTAIGGMSYIYSCSDMSIHILRDPTPARWNTVSAGAMGLSLLFGGSFSIAGYLLFFQNTDGNILDNFGVTDIMAIILRIFLCFNICVSIPFGSFMPRVVILSLFKAFVPHLSQDNYWPRNFLHFIATSIVIISSTLTAIAVTDLGVLYSVIGGMSSCTVSLLITPIIYLKLFGQDTITNIKCYFLIIAGATGFLGTFSKLFY